MFNSQMSAPTPLNANRRGLKSVEFCGRSRSWAVLARFAQSFLQDHDLFFGNEATRLPMCERIGVMTVRRMNQGNGFDIQFEPEAGDPSRNPIMHGRFADTADDLCGLSRVVIPISVLIDVGIGLGHFHPETKAEIQPESKCFVAEPDRGFCQHFRDQADGFYA